MTTLSFQPEADRYYAEGYWRPGDLWGDFAARAHAQPDKVALVLDDRRVTYDELRRAAVALSARLAARSVQPGDVVVLLGRHSIEAAVAMLGCLHRGVVLAPLPPMFNVTQLSALAGQTGAKAIVGFGGEKELAKCEQAAPIVEQLISLLPATLDELIAEDAADERRERRRRRDRDGHAFLRHHVGAEGHRALEQHAALRHRGHLPALGARRRRRLPRGDRVRLRRRTGLRVPAGAAQRRHRRPDEPVEARGGASAHRGAPLHVRAADADARRRHPAGGAGHDARPVVDARPRGARPHAGAPARDAGGVRDPPAGRLRPLRGAGPRGARPARAGGEDAHDRGPAV